MKKELFQEIEIPEGIEVEIEGSLFKVKGPEGENERTFGIKDFEFKKEDNKVVIRKEKATKHDKKIMNTIASHIKNMIQGVQNKFEYHLKICFSHFPINVEMKGDEVVIKNFLGERAPRKTRIPKGAEVEIDRDKIIVKSVDKELAGQVAANFEIVTKVGKKDKRIFQDGIFLTNKAGREI